MDAKKLWLASTAVLSIAGAPAANADGLYISVLGGTNFQPEGANSVRFTTGPYILSSHTDLESQTGFMLGAAVGARLEKWLTGLRAELEVSYRRNDVNGNWAALIDLTTDVDPPFTFGGSIEANLSTFALMANVAYDIDAGWKAKPYIMAGAGFARSRIEGAVTGSYGGDFDAESNGFAWQLGAGFNYEVSPGVDVGMGYRYFDAPNTSFFGGKFGAGQSDNKNHAVMINLTVETN